jgi:hypothetical protein
LAGPGASAPESPTRTGDAMLPCEKCAYRRSIPGDSHLRCVFDWMAHDLFGLVGMFRDVTPKVARWFRFPFNYDPMWGPNECPQRAETADPAKVAPPSPWADLLSLLR